MKGLIPRFYNALDGSHIDSKVPNATKILAERNRDYAKKVHGLEFKTNGL
jgi:hypothetical protein